MQKKPAPIIGTEDYPALSGSVHINGREVDFSQLQYNHQGQLRKLSYRSMKLLDILCRHPGETISRQTLLNQVWDKSIATDYSLSQAISELRRALGDQGKQIILTIPRIGYSINPKYLNSPTQTAVPATQEAQTEQTEKALYWPWVVVAVFLLSLLWWSAPPLREPAKLSLNPLLRVTAEPGIEDGVSLSPDGSEVIYIKNQPDQSQLVIRAVGSVQERILHSSDTPLVPVTRWSFDGQKIAYMRVTKENPPFVINTIHRDGSQDKPVVRTFINTNIEWLPDNQTLLYADGNLDKYILSIRAVDIRNGEQTAFKYPGVSQHQDVAPRLSADGRYLAWRRGLGVDSQLLIADLSLQRLIYQDSFLGLSDYDWLNQQHSLLISRFAEGQTGLWQLKLNGSQQLLKTTDLFARVASARHTGHIAYSEGSRRTEIMLGRPNSQQVLEPSRVISSTTDDYAPALNPVTSKLAFVSERSGYAAIWLIDTERPTPARQLSFSREATCHHPVWSADGRYLAYVETQPAQQTIVQYDTQTDAQQRLALKHLAKINSLSFGITPQQLFLSATDEYGESGIYSADLDARTTAKIHPINAAKLAYQSGGILFSTSEKPGLYRFELESGKETLLSRMIWFRNRYAWTLTDEAVIFIQIGTGLTAEKTLQRLDLQQHTATQSIQLDPLTSMSVLSGTTSGLYAIVRNKSIESDIILAELTHKPKPVE